MNAVEVTGRLTRDPEVRFVGSGGDFAIATLSVAVENSFGRWNRETKKTEVESGFYQVEIPGPYGESIANHLTRGDEVYIRGSLTQWAKQLDDGTTDRKTRIRADVVIAKIGAPVASAAEEAPGWSDEPF